MYQFLHLWIVFLMSSLETLYLAVEPKDFLLPFSKSFIILHSISKPMICFEVIFVCDAKVKAHFFTYGFQLLSHYLL